MIRLYLSNIINDYKAQGEWKIQLIIAINFISSKDSNETCTMRTKSDKMEIMMGSETDETTEELFESHLQKYQEKLEESINGSDFVFNSIDLLYKKLYKISLNRGALNILYVPYNAKGIRYAYKSEYNFKRKNQIILLMIIDSKKWDYLAVKSLSVLYRAITSKHNKDF